MTSIVKLSQVLVGMDFDEASASALTLAGTLAAVSNAGITAFHGDGGGSRVFHCVPDRGVRGGTRAEPRGSRRTAPGICRAAASSYGRGC
jgi:hypothetical protein